MNGPWWAVDQNEASRHLRGRGVVQSSAPGSERSAATEDVHDGRRGEALPGQKRRSIRRRARREGPTVSDYAEEWLGMLVRVRPATAREYRRELETYVLPRIGSAQTKRMTRGGFGDAHTTCENNRRPVGVPGETVRRILAPLR